MMNDCRIQAGQQILRWIGRQGAVFYYGKPERETAKSYLRGMSKVFPEEIAKLNAIYLYRMADQPDSLNKYDGICWVDVTLNGRGTLYAIGISLEALAEGPEYTQFLFIHELTHIVVPCAHGEHSAEFHVACQRLLKKYDEQTGSCLSARRKISEEDQAKREHMQKSINTGKGVPKPPLISPSTPVTSPKGSLSHRRKLRHSH